jgi:hypothetical protein
MEATNNNSNNNNNDERPNNNPQPPPPPSQEGSHNDSRPPSEDPNDPEDPDDETFSVQEDEDLKLKMLIAARDRNILGYAGHHGHNRQYTHVRVNLPPPYNSNVEYLVTSRIVDPQYDLDVANRVMLGDTSLWQLI